MALATHHTVIIMCDDQTMPLRQFAPDRVEKGFKGEGFGAPRSAPILRLLHGTCGIIASRPPCRREAVGWRVGTRVLGCAWNHLWHAPQT